MHVTIQELDNQGVLTGIISIDFTDIHTITAKQKTTGNLKREFTLHRKSDSPYILDQENKIVVDSPLEFKEWLDDISKHLKI